MEAVEGIVYGKQRKGRRRFQQFDSIKEKMKRRDEDRMKWRALMKGPARGQNTHR